MVGTFRQLDGVARLRQYERLLKPFLYVVAGLERDRARNRPQKQRQRAGK